MPQSPTNITAQIIFKIGKTPDKVIPILQAIQKEFNYLPKEILEYVCETTEITASQIYSVSTFYSQFRHKEVGKHIINVCIGTACHVKGAMLVYEAFRRELKLDETFISKNLDTQEDDYIIDEKFRQDYRINTIINKCTIRITKTCKS